MTTPDERGSSTDPRRQRGDDPDWLGWDGDGRARAEARDPQSPWLSPDVDAARVAPSSTDAGAGPGAGAVSGSRTASGSRTGSDSRTGSGSPTGSNSRTGSGSSSRTGARTGSGSGAGAGAGTGGAASAGDAPTPGGLHVLGAAVKEFAIVVGMALVLSFIVKTWLLQAFYIPSGSMEDTLQINDRVIVSKLTPGPIDLKRGDIVVFADPGDWVEAPIVQQRGKVATVVRDALTFVGLLPDTAENHLIKRVIGLPGDRVVCCDEGGRLTVNGEPVKEPYIHEGDAASEREFDITVPRGRLWVMGDHRSDSSDSRFHDAPEDDGSRGSVDERLVVGRAVVLVWPLDHLTWLSNPTATFAKVPAPSGADPAGTQQPTPDSTVRPTGEGGGEVPGGDSSTPVGLGPALTTREHGGD